MSWDVFVSHASEDKDEFVRPLVHGLSARGLRVWFDEFTLTVGDSLRRSIDRGLASSRFGIVVISRNFLHKEWPQKELDGLVAREIGGVKVILPVWHNIDAATIRSYSPLLADRLATSSDKGLDNVIEELIRAIQRDDPARTTDRGPSGVGRAVKFIETPSSTNIAFFWAPSEVLATVGSGSDVIEYRFDEPRAFYLRLIPTSTLPEPLRATTLIDLTQRRRAQVLTRTMYGSVPGRNRFGAISYEPHGNSPTPVGLTQLFRNGELWGVSGEFAARYKDVLIVPMVNVENIYRRVLANFISIAGDDLKIAPPYRVELGATGLKDMRVSLPRPANQWDDLSEPIYENDLKVQQALTDTNVANQTAILEEFLDKLYDIAGVPTQPRLG